jgi:hypothetical protein
LTDALARYLPESRTTRKLWLGGFGLSVVLLLLPFVFRLDGKAHADWEQFLGRFHPLAVHLPIGLIVLVPVLEVAGVVKPALRETAGFVLGLGFLSCLGALTLGYLLAYGSGDAGAGVSRHMWGGIWLTIGSLICLLARPWWISGSVGKVYPVLLTGLMLVLTWTAHQGGSLTHGGNYLTEFMPRWMKLGGPGEVVAPDSFYAQHIHPVLDARCVECHGESEVKGGLRLDTYDGLMRGGADGPAVVAGKPERSMLLQRVTLPPDHKGFMPAEGKPPLKPEEIAWIRAWVIDGASATAKTVAGVKTAEKKVVTIEPVGDYSALMGEIAAMDKGNGAKLVQVSSKASDGLILNTVDAPGSFGDAQLAGLVKFAPYVVEAELGRTAVTDQSFATLAKFTHLRALHLEGTAVTGAGLGKLSSLKQMTYLNLSGTKVTAANVALLSGMKNLESVYLYNTPAQPLGAAPAVARSGP